MFNFEQRNIRNYTAWANHAESVHCVARKYSLPGPGCWRVGCVDPARGSNRRGPNYPPRPRKSVLQTAGYDTVSASTVAEAVAIIEDPEQKLDLLFTDLGLADQTDGGLAVGQTMAKSRPGLPVVYTTGRGVTDGIVKRFVEPSKFIPKPYTDNQLVSAAAELLH